MATAGSARLATVAAVRTQVIYNPRGGSGIFGGGGRIPEADPGFLEGGARPARAEDFPAGSL